MITDHELKAADLLLIGEDAQELQRLADGLKQAGFGRVKRESAAAQALESCRTGSHHLIVADGRPPEIDGFGVLPALQGINPEDRPPVLFLSSELEPDACRRVVQAGGRDVMARAAAPWELASRVRNLLELRLLQQQLRALTERSQLDVLRDELTGLANRLALAEQVNRTLRLKRAHPDIRFSLLYLGIDRPAGLAKPRADQLLTEISVRINTVGSGRAGLFHLGNCEFVALLDGAGASDEVTRLATDLHGALTKPYYLEGGTVTVQLAMGAANDTTEFESADAMLRVAERAMRRAKGEAVEDGGSLAAHRQTAQLTEQEQALQGALDRNEFRVFYQPILDLRGDAIAGFEALLRWKHPERGYVYPSAFLQAASETRMIVSIGSWVMREAAKQLAEWRTRLNKPLFMSINVDDQQFRDELLPQLMQVIQEHGLKPEDLMLELTDNVLLDEPERTERTMRLVKDLGVRCALAGTGLSSVSTLERFPLYGLKIDRSLAHNARNRTAGMIRAIVELATRHRLELFAEGLENDDDVEFIRHFARFGQGYKFGPPKLPEDSETVLKVGSK